MILCLAANCENPVYCKDYCRGHYERLRRTGDAETRAIAPKGAWLGTICSVENCEKPVQTKHLCGKHYKRSWRHGDPTETKLNMEGGVCIVDDCIRPRSSTDGLCKMHYLRDSRHGRLHTVRAPAGAGRQNAGGYKMIWYNGKLQYEHIVAAEKALGKPLPKGAVVHHMNRDKQDNFSYGNLVVCPDQAYHMMIHQRMAALELKEQNQLFFDELFPSTDSLKADDE